MEETKFYEENTIDEENKSTVEKKTCFVITPIGEDNSSIRRHIDGVIKAAIRPALGHKYDIRVAHEFTATGSINNQVIIEIYNADLVITNLTDLNPNVMYELAIRHSLRKPVIMIMEKGNGKLPFDVINERTIFYTNDFQGVLDLKNELIKYEKALIDKKVSNPIYDALSTYVSDESLIKNIESTNKEDASVLKVILNKMNNLESFIDNKNSEISEVSNYIEPYVTITINNSTEISDIEKDNISKQIFKVLNKQIEKVLKYRLKGEYYYKHNTWELTMNLVPLTKNNMEFHEIEESIEYIVNFYLEYLGYKFTASCSVGPF